MDDGLLVEPFRVHTQRVGPLQFRGFTAHVWRDWAQLVAQRIAVTDAADVYVNPVALAPAPFATNEMLQSQWSNYLLDLPQSDRFNSLSLRDVEENLDLTTVQSYFENSKVGLPRLYICIVRYLSSVWLMVTPNVAIVGDGDLTPSVFVRIIHDTIEKQKELTDRSTD